MAGIHQDCVNVVRVEVRYTMTGTNAANVFHVWCNSAPNEATLTDIAAKFTTWLDTDWSAYVSNNWTAAEIVCTDLSTIRGPRMTFPIAIIGEVESDALPSNATLALKADIGTRGKGLNGRVFHVGLSELHVTANTIVPATLTALIGVYNALIAIIEADPDYEGLCVPHFVVGGVRVPIADKDRVRRFTAANNLVDSQKNRLPLHKKRKKKVTAPAPS